MINVTIIPNGPVIVNSDSGEEVKIVGDDTTTCKQLAICRCGKSKDGINCDGSHKDEPLL